MVYYPTLISEMAKCEVSRADIANGIGITQKALYNKLSGRTEFTWREVQTVIERFFPYHDPQDLFARSEQAQDSA